MLRKVKNVFHPFLTKADNIIFHVKKLPPITLDKYLDRILQYTEVEESTVIIMLIFIDRICETSNLYMTQNCIHRYFTFKT